MTEGRTLRFEWGGIECTIFNDFTNPQSLSQLVTGVPEGRVRENFKKLGLPHNPALLDTNVLLVSMDGTRVLIDSGWGPQGDLLNHLRAEGISPDEIGLVIITHTDGDHVGGLLDAEGNLTFANAEYVMTEAAWNRWTSDSYLGQLPDERASWVRTAADLMRDRTRSLNPDDEVVPGARMMGAPGHRDGHAAVVISPDRGEMLHVADAVLHPIFVSHPSWRSPIDSYPDQAAQTRRRLLERAAEEEMLVVSAHLPFPGLGHVRAQGSEWVWQPLAYEDERD